MQQIADFHIHSRFSRACSRDLTLENLDATGRVKGVQIIGTGDFTQPEWFREMEEELEEIKKPKKIVIPGELQRGKGIQSHEQNRLDPRLRRDDKKEGNGSGLYKLKSAIDDKIKFTLTSEVALIYKDLERVRRIHLVLHGPSIEAVRELNIFLGRRFNLRSDGRPILGISVPEFVKLVLSIHPNFLIYPAHIWTPWFSVFGSKSGFDSFEECFRDQTPNIFAYETGLSSDPEMNWRVPALDKLTMLSNSDAHSLQNIGREANIFELAVPTYLEIYEAIKTKDTNKLKGTIEFYPEEGMYHFDGHRDCGVSFAPSEFAKHHGICPVCKKPLTIGVGSRVAAVAGSYGEPKNELAAQPSPDGFGVARPEGFVLPGAPGFEKLIELDKIIAQSLGVKSRGSVRVQRIYNDLINALGDEISILRMVKVEKIAEVGGNHLAEGIGRMRAGEVKIIPGFDGQYGEVKVF